MLETDNDTVYVINFWATWCNPCVAELPDFLQVANELKDEKVRFIFVSLDFPSQKESHLLPFIKNKKMTEQVILLNDPHVNKWIEQVNNEWSGGIPVTVIYKGNNRFFKEGELDHDELTKEIRSKL